MSFAMPFNGFPFYMSAGTCIHAVLAAGTRQLGQPWGARPIAGVPSHGQMNSLRGEGGRTWMFRFN